jgi:hypothetical protein
MAEHPDLDRRRERAARNESLFREVNERIEDLAGSASFSLFICECMNESCDEPVSVTLEEYEYVRSGPNRFIVLRGHEIGEVDEVIESSERYLIVAKRGAGRDVAEALDPRGPRTTPEQQ